MKFKTVLIPLLALVLVGCSEPQPVEVLRQQETPSKSESVNLLDWLNVYDTNYIRDTQMHFTSEAYNIVSKKNKFPFTQSRQTLWVDNGLYMTTLSEMVNAGYYSVKENGKDQLYRYTLPSKDPATHINDTVVPDGFNSVKQTGYEVACNDFFVNMHKFNNNQEWANKFSYVDNYFVSTDLDILDDFMAFTASCYTNPFVEEEILGTPDVSTQARHRAARLTNDQGDSVVIEKRFLEFKEARIYKETSGDTLWLKLYVKDEYKSKVETSDGLFSVAKVYNADKTNIPVLDAYLGR